MGFIGILQVPINPWVIAWLVPAWSVAWSCALCSFAVPVMSRVRRGIGETFVRMMNQTRISSRYRVHCRLRLQFSCHRVATVWEEKNSRTFQGP